MLDLRNLTDRDMTKYELCKDNIDNDTFFIRIDDSEWWVVGIDEQNDIIYAQNDKISHYDIDTLSELDYILLGTQKDFVPGMTSTRTEYDPIDDVKDFIEHNTVYKLKYIGIGSIIYNKLNGYLDEKHEIRYKILEK